MKFPLRRLALAAAAVLALGASQSARADSTTLAALLEPGATLVCGDKVFSNFSGFSTVATGGATAPTADQIVVECVQNGDGSVEINFASVLWRVTANQILTTTFTYDVAVVQPSPNQIVGLTSSLLAFSFSGGGLIQLDDDVYGTTSTPYDTFLGTISLDSSIPVISDSLDLYPGYETLRITKSLALSGGPAGRASAGRFADTFTQAIVPEPSSVVLVGVGATLLLGCGWRRRRSG